MYLVYDLRHPWSDGTTRVVAAVEEDATGDAGDGRIKRAVSPGETAALADGDELNLDGMEQRYIRQALDRTNDNRTEAARLLSVTFRSLRYRLSKLGITGPDVPDGDANSGD